MDNHVGGGSVPSSLAALVAAMPLLRPIGSVAHQLNCSNGALERRTRQNLIPPPLLLGSRRLWLEPEVDIMARCDDWRAVEVGTGQQLLDRRIEDLASWLEVVSTCGDRFDFEYVPATNHKDRPGDEAFKGRCCLKSACRSAGSAPVWHRLPYTYGTLRHRAADYAHLTSGRSGASRLLRTVDIIAWNLSEQLDQSRRARAALLGDRAAMAGVATSTQHGPNDQCVDLAPCSTPPTGNGGNPNA